VGEQIRAEDGGEDAAAVEDDPMGEASARPRRILAPQDGDPVTVIETPAPQDGLIDRGPGRYHRGGHAFA
jgi:hypothetical protein